MSDSHALEPWSELGHLSNEQVLSLCWSSPFTLEKPTSYSDVLVRRIASDAVVKLPVDEPHEALHMHLVRSQTNVPVPAVLREVRFPSQLNHCMVMEYIPGQTLEECWTGLSFLRKLWVIWTVRGYVRQLRRISHTVMWPGPVGDEPQKCYGPLFSTMNAGPFSSYSELVDWYNHKYEVAKRMNSIIRGCGRLKDVGPFPSQHRLVFTHLDLNPHNIMLGDDGRIWLIDFGLSGFYPEWFEFTAMYEWESMGWLGKLGRRIIAGFHARQARFIKYISWALEVGYVM